MLAIATVLVALLISLVITRIATIALAVTGMSRESARFQARSAFTGVGYTTRESEAMVNHPVRRRVILLLMLLGNAGLVTIVASLLISFSRAEGAGQTWSRLGLLLGGLFAIFLLATNKTIDRGLSRLITRMLRRYTDLDVRDYAALLQLTGGYGVVELQVQRGHWSAGKTLDEMDLRHEGIAVLGIEKPDGSYVGVPRGGSVVEIGDTMLLYGRVKLLSTFGERALGTDGDKEHAEAVALHQERHEDRPQALV